MHGQNVEKKIEMKYSNSVSREAHKNKSFETSDTFCHINSCTRSLLTQLDE